MPNFETIIANLTHLEYLDLSYMSIASNLPLIIFNLPKLISLERADCDLEGELPATNLNTTMSIQFIDLSENMLPGIIPGWIFTLPSLNSLSLDENLFTGIGEFEIGNDSISRTSLTEFWARDNRLPGKIPQAIFELHNLNTLYLSSNNFSGTILFSTIYKLKKLSWLSLSDNSLSIIDDMGSDSTTSWPNFPELSLSSCNLTHFPGFLRGQLSLQILELFNNGIHGVVRDWFLDIGCGLVGEFPSRNLNTTMLSQIDLSNNTLIGIIPGSIFTLPFLNYLRLDDNLFTGIAEFKFDNDSISRTSLTQFTASSNRLQGKIPDAIFDLHNLQYLSLGINNLTETIPLSRIHKLHNLNQLFLSHNNLSFIDDMGPDSTPSSWPSFHYISLSSCNLGHFPAFLKEQRNLDWLDLSYNHIHGVVPHWFLNVSTTSLINLDLSHNSLSGGLEQLPWKNLEYIDIGYNLFQSVVPVPSPTAYIFMASNNQFTGVIPPSLCDIGALDTLNLSQNNLTGNIPSCLASVKYLSLLLLGQNQLQGVIPSSMFEDSSYLNILSLSGNKFEGTIPQTLNKCLRLEFLDLSSNKLNDTFPHLLGVLPALKVLILGSNNLQGSLTGSNTTNTFPMLQILDISSNDLTGSLPRDLLMSMKAMVEVPMSNDYLYMNTAPIVVWYKGITRRLDVILETMVLIDVSKNRFQGPIPDAIGGLVSLRSLNLDHNNFSGHIPSSLGNLTLLESLDLSYNRLGGGIPGELVNLKSLEVFNVSENDLVGPVPTGKQFDTFVDKSYMGNPGLCGPLLTKKCGIPNDDSNQATSGGSTDESTGFYVWESGLMGCGCGILVGLAWGYLIFWKMTPHWAIRLILKIETLAMVHIGGSIKRTKDEA